VAKKKVVPVQEEGSRKWISKKLSSVLCRLVLSSSVYNIWRARNGLPLSIMEDQTLRSRFLEAFFGK